MMTGPDEISALDLYRDAVARMNWVAVVVLLVAVVVIAFIVSGRAVPKDDGDLADTHVEDSPGDTEGWF